MAESKRRGVTMCRTNNTQVQKWKAAQIIVLSDLIKTGCNCCHRPREMPFL
ncbi:MAG: hypothetical protein GXY18_06815 [Methanomicrobiales archaeon]|nr:hypothetical protein [Methanomicrobiales archaeon]